MIRHEKPRINSGCGLRHELIYHDAGATTPEILNVDQIKHLIAEAGRDPVERDTVYHHIHRNPDNFKDWFVGKEVAVFQEA